MRRFFSVLRVCVTLLCVCTGLHAEDIDKNNRSITYADYMKAVTETLPDLTRNRLQVQRAENSLDGAYSAGDVRVTAEGSWSNSDSYSSQYTGSGAEDVTEYSLSAGIAKKFTSTGTTLEAGIGHDTIRADSYGTRYYPSIYLKFSQSILKNSFGLIDRYAVNDAAMKLEIEKIKQAESDKTTLNYYSKLYFTWIENSGRLELLRDSISYAEIIESDTEKKYKAGLAGIDDLYNARAVVNQYRINYQKLLSTKESIEAEIRIIIGDGFVPVRSDFDAMYDEARESAYGSVPFSRTQGAEVYRLTKNNLVYTLDVGRNRLLPELDIVGQYTRKSQDDEFSGFTALDESDYYIGFSASYPLFNTEAESSLKGAEIAIEEINAEYKISENAYNGSLEKLVIEKDGLKRMIELSESRIKLLDARYNTVYKKYRQGNMSLQQVIDALQDITNEKTVLFQYKSSLIQGYLDYTDLTRPVSGSSQ